MNHIISWMRSDAVKNGIEKTISNTVLFKNIQEYSRKKRFFWMFSRVLSYELSEKMIFPRILNLEKLSEFNLVIAYKLYVRWIFLKPWKSLANTLSRGVQAQKLSVAVDEAKCVITEVIRVMNLEWLLPTYKHVTFISALHAVRKLQREQHIPSSSTIFIRFSKEGNFSDVRKKVRKYCIKFGAL